MASKPVQRSLKDLRENGWTCCIVEKWIAPIKKRQDAFGFADILACRALPTDRLDVNGKMVFVVGQVALIQATDHTSHAKRREKTLSLPEFLKWKQSGGLVFLDSWGKKGPRGVRKTWQLRREVL